MSAPKYEVYLTTFTVFTIAFLVILFFVIRFF